MAASVSSSSEVPFFRSNHCTDQFSAPSIKSLESFTGARNWPLACSAYSTGVQAVAAARAGA